MTEDKHIVQYVEPGRICGKSNSDCDRLLSCNALGGCFLEMTKGVPAFLENQRQNACSPKQALQLLYIIKKLNREQKFQGAWHNLNLNW